VFDWVRETNRALAAGQVDVAHAVAALADWAAVDRVLGIGGKSEAEAPAEIVALLESRQAARKGKDFKRADAVRDELKAKGWVIEDTPKGPRLKRIS
jgi:cysteinyl-tRNA synthetase